MTRGREALLALAAAAVGLGLFLAAAEIALRFLPVASGMRTLPVTTDQPVMRFAPDRPFLFSRGWDLEMVNRGRVNNAGFVNDQDYRRDDPLPLLAVIGDSYIEAAMVPYAQTVHGRLAGALEGRLRVYSFAASGAPLSQYLVWARHAVQAFGAQALVINVVGNDFDESHVAYKTGPGLWLYSPAADGGLVLALQAYRPGLMRALVYRSALARYLLFNLTVGAHLFEPGFFGGLVRRALADAGRAPRFAGNTAADVDPARVAVSLAVIEAFFRDLPGMAGLPPERILFLVDGFRHPDAARQGAGTYFDLMRRAFLAKAAAQGYEAIDLDALFFRNPGQAYNYPRDGHWNPAGHAVAAEAVMASKTLARVRP
jgi:hypothetical protein